MLDLRRLRSLLNNPVCRARAAAALVVLLFLAGLGLRLIDLTDPPLDFHPTRQLRAAIIARGMYYQMQPVLPNSVDWLGASTWPGAESFQLDPAKQETAIDLWHGLEVYEPQVFERLIALTYLFLGAEVLWVARIYSILFWLLGGWPVFELARRATSFQGGLLALAVYLFVPLGVIASRSFQPEALMVSLVLWAAYSADRWSETHSWRWCLLTGLLSGMAVLIKAPAVFQVAPLLVLIVLSTWGIRSALHQPQVWTAAVMTIAIGGSYYLYQMVIQPSGYFQYWSSSFRYMLLDPGFYVRWLVFLDRNVMGVILIFASLAGMMLFSSRGKAIAAGLWVGYALIGLTVPYLITTHDYYSLPLVPAAAFSLAPFARPICRMVSRQPIVWRTAFYAVLILALAFPAWITRSALLGQDYRAEILGWQLIGRELPTDGSIIALTHDYGNRLRYYGWVSVGSWPSTSDLEMNALRGGNDAEFAIEFTQRTHGYDYFLVTLLSDLETQPQLARMLYENYPLLAEGGGYTLFDLR